MFYILFQFAMVESVISAILDEFPTTLRTRRSLVSLVIHVLGFTLGLSMVTKVSSQLVSEVLRSFPLKSGIH